VHKVNSVINLAIGDILTIKNNEKVVVFSTGAMLKYVVDFVV